MYERVYIGVYERVYERVCSERMCVGTLDSPVLVVISEGRYSWG